MSSVKQRALYFTPGAGFVMRVWKDKLSIVEEFPYQVGRQTPSLHILYSPPWATQKPLRNHTGTIGKTRRFEQKPLTRSKVDLIIYTCVVLESPLSLRMCLSVVSVWFLNGFWVAHGRLYKMCREGVCRPTWYGNSSTIESLSFQDAHDEASARREI